MVQLMQDLRHDSEAYHILAEEFKALQRSHCLRARLDVTKNYVRLTSHILGLESHYVQHWTIGGEECIQRESQILLLELIRKILDIKPTSFFSISFMALVMGTSRLIWNS